MQDDAPLARALRSEMSGLQQALRRQQAAAGEQAALLEKLRAPMSTKTKRRTRARSAGVNSLSR